MPLVQTNGDEVNYQQNSLQDCDFTSLDRKRSDDRMGHRLSNETEKVILTPLTQNGNSEFIDQSGSGDQMLEYCNQNASFENEESKRQKTSKFANPNDKRKDKHMSN